MTYTIISARYSNDGSTAAIVKTAESSEVAASVSDTPELWSQMLAWGEPEAYAPPEVPQPTIVSASQAKIALYNAGLLEDVEAAVAVHPYEPVRIWYEAANEWHRGHAYVQALGLELGLTDDVIDGLFVAANML